MPQPRLPLKYLTPPRGRERSLNSQKSAQRRRPLISNMFQVLPQSRYNLFTLRVRHRMLQFFESEMHHVVMMNFFVSHLVAELQPDAVEKIDLLRCKMRRMRPKIIDLVLPRREKELKRQLRLGIRQSLPCQAGEARIFDDGCI